MNLWYPGAARKPVTGHEKGAGPFSSKGAPKILHHTTEGSSFAGAFGTYGVTGDLPHFTDSFEGGVYQVWQHLPLDVAATALVHPKNAGETNHDNVIQIEHVGTAATSASWAPGYLDGIAELCRWIEGETGCVPVAGVAFQAGADRLEWSAWHTYSGHLGHMHCPFNDHHDPGPIDIARIIAGAGAASATGKVTAAGTGTVTEPEEADDMAMIALVPGAPADKLGRIQHWTCDAYGNIQAWNKAPDLKSLNQITTSHGPIIGIAALPGGNGVVLISGDGHHDDGVDEWAQSTYVITAGM